MLVFGAKHPLLSRVLPSETGAKIKPLARQNHLSASPRLCANQYLQVFVVPLCFTIPANPGTGDTCPA